MVEFQKITALQPKGKNNRWRTAKVLLLDSDKQSAMALGKIVRAAAAEVIMLHSLEQFIENPVEFDIVIVNYDSLSPNAVELCTQIFTNHKQDGRMLFCSQNVRRNEFSLLLEDKGLANFIARNDELDSEDLLVTIQKIVRQDIFGIDKYFSWGAHAYDTVFRSSNDIQSLLIDVRTLASTIQIPQRLAETFLTVVDELATNAVYNAPRDEQQRAKYASQDRSVEVVLNTNEAVQACFRFDGRRLGISVSDQSGSLKTSDICAYLSRCFRQSSDQIEWKSGGAGIGLYQTYESLSHFIVNLAPHVRTEVIGLIDVRGSYRDFASRAKSFNMFLDTDLAGDK